MYIFFQKAIKRKHMELVLIYKVLKVYLLKNDKYILNIIHVSSNYSECCVKYSDKNVIEYYIPDSFYRFNKNTEKAYYRNIWYILVSYVEICKQKKSIFIFNY